nr:MAG: hypothetical protein [Reoviridae sp.]
MSFTPNTPVVIDATPIVTNEFFDKMVQMNDIVTSNPAPESMNTIGFKGAMVIIHNDTNIWDLEPVGNFLSLCIEYSTSFVQLNAYYYGSKSTQNFKCKFTRDTLVRIINPWAQTSVLMSKVDSDAYFVANTTTYKHICVSIPVTTTRFYELATVFRTSFSTFLTQIGVTTQIQTKIKADKGCVTYIVTNLATENIDLSPSAFIIVYHISYGESSGFIFRNSSAASMFYGLLMQTTSQLTIRKNISGTSTSGYDTNIRSFFLDFDPQYTIKSYIEHRLQYLTYDIVDQQNHKLNDRVKSVYELSMSATFRLAGISYPETVVSYVDAKVKNLVYTPSLHNNRTLDNELVYQYSLNTSNTAAINAINASIPNTLLAGRTILSIIADGDVSSINISTAKATDLVNGYKAVNDANVLKVSNNLDIQTVNLTQLQGDYSQFKNQTSAGLISNANSITTVDAKYKRITDDILQTLSGISIDQIRNLEVRVNHLEDEVDALSRDFPNISKLRDEFQLLIDQMFSTQRFSRRVGYYNVPSIGKFQGDPVILITNEGILLANGINKNACVKVTFASLLTDNPTMKLDFIAQKRMWMCVAQKDPYGATYPTISVQQYKTIIGYIIYVNVELGVHVIQGGVLYATYGPSVYV